MLSRRKHPRVEVSIPLACAFVHQGPKQKGHVTRGLVYNLSIGGMKVGLPEPVQCIHSGTLCYALNLPDPFGKLSGQGEIKWVHRDDENHQLVLGLQFIHLNSTQLQNIKSIVTELSEDKTVLH